MQRRAVRRLARRQQRDLLLQRRDGRAQADRSTTARIKIQSGETDFKTVATLRWDAAAAKKRMEDLLTKTYSDGTTSTACSRPTTASRVGIIAALKGTGYGTGGKTLPVVTGQDAELESVKSILAGEQYSTIFKDTRELAKVHGRR